MDDHITNPTASSQSHSFDQVLHHSSFHEDASYVLCVTDFSSYESESQQSSWSSDDGKNDDFGSVTSESSRSATEAEIITSATRDELIDRACPATAFVLRPKCTFDDADPFKIPIIFDHDLVVLGRTPVVIRGHSVVAFTNFVLALRWHALHRILSPADCDRFHAILYYLERCPKSYRLRPTDMIQRGLQGPIGRGMIHGPWNRPLSDAAMRQNAEARYNCKLDEVAIALGSYKPKDIRLTPDPVRYGDTYSDLFGTRSEDDDCSVTYARRYGCAFMAEFEHYQNLHNGHESRVNHRYTNTSDRNLIEARQMRDLAGLNTHMMDLEILYRVRSYPMQWGWFGRFVVNARWTQGFSCATCSPLSPREQDDNRQYFNDLATSYMARERLQAELEESRPDWQHTQVETEAEDHQRRQMRVEMEEGRLYHQSMQSEVERRYNSRGARLGRMIHGNTL